MVVAVSLAGCASEVGLGYAVAYHGAVEMKKPDDHGLDIYPWMARRGVDGTEVMFWTCGFAKVVYSETPLLEPHDSYRDEPRRLTAYQAMTDEWCDLGPFLFEHEDSSEQLLVYRRWQGKKYLLDHAPVFRDDDHAEYIARRGFSRDTELEPLLRSVAQGDDNNGCFGPHSAELEWRKDTEDIVRVGNDYCFSHGVYLRDLARQLRQATQTPPGPLATRP
jgi:hypothetical protein